MKRTPLKRKTPLKAKSGLKQTKPLRKVSPNKKKYSNKRMIYNTKVWSLKRADVEFSKWIREQRGYTCEMCGFYDAPPTKKIQCSHYIGRAHKATRYDVENCDVLCASCHHKMEDLKQYDYRDWKIKQLGEKKHNELRERGKGTLGEKDSIYNCMKLLGKL